MSNNYKGWDVFISHCTSDDSFSVYHAVYNFMTAKGLRVFNPTSDLSHCPEINSEQMANCVKRSRLVLVALSEGFFESSWCKAEVNAARQSGIKVIPIYSGDAHASTQADTWVKDYRSDPVYNYIFRENIRDVLNRQNRSSTIDTLNYVASLLGVKESVQITEITESEAVENATKKFKELLVEKSWHYSDIFGGGKEPTFKNLKNEVINKINWPGDSKQRFIAHLDGNSWHRGYKKATRDNLGRLADNFS